MQIIHDKVMVVHMILQNVSIRMQIIYEKRENVHTIHQFVPIQQQIITEKSELVFMNSNVLQKCMYIMKHSS